MKCPNCSKEVSPEFNVCPWCGYKSKKCSNPEHQDIWLPEEAFFCPRCGEPLSGGINEKASSSRASQKRDNDDTLNKNLEFDINGIRFTMIFVQGGTFMMGAQCDDEDDDYYDADAGEDEGPVHEVTLSDYHIGETPVPQELWEAVMDDNPSEFEGSDHPVDSVSWDDCQSFIKKLNSKLRDQLPRGSKFRLPTEAEWEFAA